MLSEKNVPKAFEVDDRSNVGVWLEEAGMIA